MLLHMIRWLFYSSQIADIMFEIDPTKRCPTLKMDSSFQFLNLLGHKAIIALSTYAIKMLSASL